MIFAALLFLAAIVTERNDTHVIPPNYATFRGTSAAPGIESCWIPYGTYTGGEGDTEYLRVTSNLTGVVASAIGGFVERYDCAYESYRLEAPQHRWLTYPCPPGYQHDFTNEADFAEFLTTNNTLRIIDVLNRFETFPQVVTNPGTYSVYSDSIYYRATGSGNGSMEDGFAWMDAGFDIIDDERHYRQIHDGVVSKFGGRQLESLAGGGAAIEPPIGTSWTTNLPFRAEDTNLWVAVWPTYAAVTNDTHFFVEIDSTNPVHDVQFTRDPLRLWMLASHLLDPQDKPIWGEDVWGDEGDGAGKDLIAELLHRPLPYNMEDVLSVDTGWKYEVPPVVTNTYWDVSGPLGNWRLKLSGTSESGEFWVNDYDLNSTNYYASILRTSNNYVFSLYRLPSWDEILIDDVSAVGGFDYVDSQDYHAQITRIYSNQDDFNHWRNMTKRLDWKRLGIICQLERQMEITYKSTDTGASGGGSQDPWQLPFWKSTAERWNSYAGQIEVPIRDESGSVISTTNFNTGAVVWTLVTQRVDVATTNLATCYPTARFAGGELGSLTARAASGGDIWVDKQELLDICTRAASTAADRASLSSGLLQFVVQGRLFPDGNDSLVWLWNVAEFEFYPDGATNHYPVSEAVYGTATFGADFLSTNLICDLTLAPGKYANTRFTTSTTSDDRDVFVKSRYLYPGSNTWDSGYVSMQKWPSLDFMLDAYGSAIRSRADNDESGLGSAMGWETIKGYNSRRSFRMNPICAECSSLAASDINRWQMAQNLNAEVQSRFLSIAGFDVKTPEVAANFRPGEEQSLIDQLTMHDLELSAALHAVLENMQELSLVATAQVEIDGSGDPASSDIANPYWEYYNPSTSALESQLVDELNDRYLLGNYTFDFTTINITNEVSAVDPVRVDAHQDQMIKTLWRFKNLRDPNLNPCECQTTANPR